MGRRAVRVVWVGGSVGSWWGRLDHFQGFGGGGWELSGSWFGLELDGIEVA